MSLGALFRVATGLLPYRCSGVLEYVRCVKNFRQNIGLQT